MKHEKLFLCYNKRVKSVRIYIRNTVFNQYCGDPDAYPVIFLPFQILIRTKMSRIYNTVCTQCRGSGSSDWPLSDPDPYQKMSQIHNTVCDKRLFSAKAPTGTEPGWGTILSRWPYSRVISVSETLFAISVVGPDP
jgi:hypothetical protein